MTGSWVKVLLVEDEARVRMAIAADLHEAGCELLEASKSSDALEILETAAHIDVVITDNQMPGDLDGLALSRLVRLRWPEIGVILISGTKTISHTDLPQGVRFLAKPYESRQLTAMVRALVPGFVA
jgi:two-component system, response regulator PdtaR